VLRELQQDLAAAFCETGVDGPAAQRALAALAPMGGVPPERSLEVYQRSLRSAVAQALAEIFPVCAELVGEDCFRAIARHHGRAHVSRHPDLAQIGETLPALIPTLGFLDSVPYLAEMARLELALQHAAGAPDAQRVADPERVADALGERPDAWRLVLEPSATLIWARHPIRAIWHAHRDPDRGDGRFRVDPISAPERLIVWRSIDGLCVDAVEERLRTLVDGIEQGAPVSQLLEIEQAVGAHGGTRLDAALSAISLLFERRWVVGVEPLGIPGDRNGLNGRCTDAASVIEGRRRTRT
jgi:hypothetical protein